MQTRLPALFTTLIAVVALVAGCSGPSQDSSQPLPDASALLKDASATTMAQSSAHLELAVTGQIAGLSVQSLAADLTQTPSVAASGTVDMLFAGQSLKGVEFVISEGDLWASITPGGGLSDFGPASAVYDVAALLDPDVGLANVLTNLSDAKADARTTVAGVKTVRVTGNVSADAVQKVCPQIGATSDVPGTVWIAEDGGHELMQVRLSPSKGNSVTMTMSKWGEPVTVDIPAV
jgi:lipoprotein LprG